MNTPRPTIDRTNTSVIFIDGLKTVSEANTRGRGWQGKHFRGKAQAVRVRAELLDGRKRLPRPPFICRLVRIGPKRLDDDNLASAFKAIRDDIADFFGVDDGDTTAIRFEYGQEAHGVHKYAVRIELTPASDQ